MGGADNLAFASGYNYMFATLRGVDVGSAGDGAVFVFNLVNLVYEVEHDFAAPFGQSRLQRFPVERVIYDPQTNSTDILGLQENLQGANTGIDVKADYRVIAYNGNGARTLFGVPYVQNLAGQYLDASGNVLDYQRDSNGVFHYVLRDANGNTTGLGAVVPPNALPEISPNAPFGVGGNVRGLSADVTHTAPGPLVWNARMAGWKWGTDVRNDLGVQNDIAALCKPNNCSNAPAASSVDLYTGAVLESHPLVRTSRSVDRNSSRSPTTPPPPTSSRSSPSGCRHRPAGAQLSELAPRSELSAGGNAILDGQITFTGRGGSVASPTYYWQVNGLADSISASIQPTSARCPGAYSYTLVNHFLGASA